MPVIRLPVLIALAGAALAVGGCDRETATPAQPEAVTAPNAIAGLNGTLDISERGAPMPEATLTLPDGTEAAFADFAGQPLLVNLWATWCAPCVHEMPMLEELAERHAGKLKVLTVSQDLNGAEAVEPYWDEAGFERLEPWLDPESALAFHYGTGMLPTTILYDAKGREVWRMIGGHDWSGARTEAMLADTLD